MPYLSTPRRPVRLPADVAAHLAAVRLKLPDVLTVSNPKTQDNAIRHNLPGKALANACRLDADGSIPAVATSGLLGACHVPGRAGQGVGRGLLPVRDAGMP